MIEQALYEHLIEQSTLSAYLTTYRGRPAVFNQEAPADADDGWGSGAQYGRVVFAVDLQGDPERAMGGTLAVDIMCLEEQSPEEIEPVVRGLIHGWFFSNGTLSLAAQWKNSSYFAQPTDRVSGCTVTFDLLGFPILTTYAPDVIDRLNKWTSERISGVHVINHSALPAAAWRPTDGECAVYWRLVSDAPSSWIRSTYATAWRMATIKGHIFAADNQTAYALAREISMRLTSDKRLLKRGESPIVVNRRAPSIDMSADPLRTGQISVEGTYGVLVYRTTDQTLNEINTERRLRNGK